MVSEIQSTLNQKWLEFMGVRTIECIGFSDLGERGLLGAFDIVSQECDGFCKIWGLSETGVVLGMVVLG